MTILEKMPIVIVSEELMAEAVDTLGDALPREMARVRDEVLPAYLDIGPAGAIAAMLMRRDLDLAAKALAEGDVVAQLQIFQSLKGFHT